MDLIPYNVDNVINTISHHYGWYIDKSTITPFPEYTKANIRLKHKNGSRVLIIFNCSNTNDKLEPYSVQFIHDFINFVNNGFVVKAKLYLFMYHDYLCAMSDRYVRAHKEGLLVKFEFNKKLGLKKQFVDNYHLYKCSKDGKIKIKVGQFRWSDDLFNHVKNTPRISPYKFSKSYNYNDGTRLNCIVLIADIKPVIVDEHGIIYDNIICPNNDTKFLLTIRAIDVHAKQAINGDYLKLSTHKILYDGDNYILAVGNRNLVCAEISVRPILLTYEDKQFIDNFINRQYF